MSTFRLEVITPDKEFFKEEVEMVILRGAEGDMGIMKNHIPLVTPLAIGKLRIKINGTYKEAAIASGFVNIQKDKTIILTDSAEWPEDIDVERARKAKERAEQRLADSQAKIDRARAQAAFERAINRLTISGR